jgi:hypothetical protein
MSGWWVVWLALAGSFAPQQGDDVEALVAGLKAPRRIDRERASRRLEELGDSARPALLRAVDSTDLELRARAAAVLDVIDGRDLARPTQVALDFRDRPLAEVVAAIGDRTSLGLILEPGADPLRKDRRITLESPGPVPFWEAVERLRAAGGLRLDLSGSSPGWNRGILLAPAGGRFRPLRPLTGNEVLLTPETGGAAPPESRSGRFLMAVTGLNHSRDRVLPGPNGRPPGSVVDRFEVRLRAIPEPGLELARLGEIEGLEVVDDLGQSLAPDGVGVESDPGNEGTAFQNTASGRGLPLSVRLRYPERAGATIRRLKGAFLVTVVGSKPGAISASLVDGLDRPTRKGDVTLTVHAVRPAPEGQNVRLVELSLARPDWGGRAAGYGYGGFGRASIAAPTGAQGSFELLDALGRRTTEPIAAEPFLIGDGRHRSIRFNQLLGTLPPVTIRYLTPTWTTLRVPFEFRDLPMP